MKTLKKSLIFFSTIIIFFVSCTKKFDAINTNPNASTVSRADWLATSLINSATVRTLDNARSFLLPYILAKTAMYGAEGFQYNSLGRGDFTRYVYLRDVEPMISFATDSLQKNAYAALGHFIRAYHFFQMTMQMGDIPYAEAVQGETDGNIRPAYDSQKNVFIGILNELDSADMLFSTGANFSGDFIYGGNVKQWRKLTNTFELHVLMNLYKKTSDADLNVIGRFNNIVGSRPLMESYADNFAVTYQNSGTAYPWSNTPLHANNGIIYTSLMAPLIDSLKKFEDRRLFYYAQPAPSALKAGGSASDYSSYIGLEPTLVYSDISTQRNVDSAYSDINKRYIDLYNPEPVGLLSYWDQEFILAEATVRGWISGTGAETYYENGISASMKFHDQYTPATSPYINNMPLTEDYINNDYLPRMKLTGDVENNIQQIITQKYLADFFQGNDFNQWFENRRTGYPVFKLNPETNLNVPNTQFPKRWLYPSSELTQNSANLQKALDNQFGGSDDYNGLMWILQ